MPTKNTDHVVLGKDDKNQDYLKCNHCGEKLVYQLPLKVDTWVNMSRSFSKSHEDCQPPNKLAETELKHG